MKKLFILFLFLAFNVNSHPLHWNLYIKISKNDKWVLWHQYHGFGPCENEIEDNKHWADARCVQE
jgi:hypothetical protein